jgi:hypothetical protein
MSVEILNTARGRIAAHLICLGRSLWLGRFSSLGFFCAGIWRGVQDAIQGNWHSSGTVFVAGQRAGSARW